MSVTFFCDNPRCFYFESVVSSSTAPCCEACGEFGIPDYFFSGIGILADEFVQQWVTDFDAIILDVEDNTSGT